MAFLLALAMAAGAGDFTVYSVADGATASSSSGGKYLPVSGVDGNPNTRWASGNYPKFPQWLEVRLNKAVVVDTVILDIALDQLYSQWKELELSFSEGEPLRRTLEPGTSKAVVRFEPRKTDRVRIAVLSVRDPSNYVGLYEVMVATDPKQRLGNVLQVSVPLGPDELEIRGRADHPCVNVTRQDVKDALDRIERHAWAKKARDQIIETADDWLRESDAYWLEFLPEPGACYAYGFTGDPITGTRLGGTWSGARCSWDHPGKVINSEGRLLPDEEYPDDGTGHVATDGRIHYFIGIWNAWVTEQWTLKALPALSQAYLLTGDERYADRGVLFLDALASIYSESTSGSWDYPSDPPSGRFARPWYQVARMLVNYVDYHDFLYHGEAMDRPSLRPGMTCRENIETYLLLDGAYYCYKHSFSGGLHNGHADYLRGALAVGCVLDMPEYVRHAIESPFSIFTMLDNNIDRDGRYYETSLGYAIHARNLYLTFADPLFNLRSAEYPEGVNLYDDPKMQSCLLAPDLQVELAGRRPNFGDSAPDTTYKPSGSRTVSTTDCQFVERLYARTSDPVARQEFGALLAYLAEGDVDQLRTSQNPSWFLWHAADPPEDEPALPSRLEPRVTGSWVAGMKGLALLRTAGQAALVRFGPCLTHGDPDDLALLYYANGYELSYDIGYGLGSTHTQVGWGSSTVSHCLVTVDEQKQLGADGSGGSLEFFGSLPSVKVVQATSENSYAACGVTEYRRCVALTESGYLVDRFSVAGGRQHDYGFGSIGTDLEPFGVADLESRPGSLAEGVEWGEKIGNDGDIIGYPNKPYWNPPPGNGYGFFFDVRAGQAGPVWGGTWSIAGAVPTRLRMHVLSPADEAVFASAPGLYPSKPESSYVMARRKADGDEPLESRFLAVYEPFSTTPVEDSFNSHPLIEEVVRLGSGAVEVRLAGGVVEVVLIGSCEVDSSFGPIAFDGDFAYLEGSTKGIESTEVLGCNRLTVDTRTTDSGPAAFEATVVEVDTEGRAVLLDTTVPPGLEQLVAVFSNPAYSRTTAYHVLDADGSRLRLHASSLTLGIGRVHSVLGPDALLSNVPHEYAKAASRQPSTRFFDGKQIVGEDGGVTRVVATTPSKLLRIDVEDSSVLTPGERFHYMDIAPGDRVRIAVQKMGTVTHF